MNLKAPYTFFEIIRDREFSGTMTQGQVDGFNFILSNIPSAWELDWAAYAFATAFWETNATMRPVREAYWLPEDWRKTHLSYYPYYGRGFVQLTFQSNYKSMGAIVGADLVGNPDLALDPVIAAKIMVFGMEHGSFSGVGLGTYFNRANEDWIGARRIINAQDHAGTIAEIGKVMLQALKSAST
jgi:hypothetical protein